MRSLSVFYPASNLHSQLRDRLIHTVSPEGPFATVLELSSNKKILFMRLFMDEKSFHQRKRLKTIAEFKVSLMLVH